MNPRTDRRRQSQAKTSVLGRRHKPDYILVLTVTTLLAIGLIVIYSVSPAISAQLVGDVDPNHFMYRQLLFLVLGFGVLGVTSTLPLNIWAKLQKYKLVS